MRFRSGQPRTVDSGKTLLCSCLFHQLCNDLAHVGRYKMNKKLHLQNLLYNQVLADPIVDPETGEVLAKKGDKLERKLLNNLIPYLERSEHKVGEKIIEPEDGILEDPI